MNKCILLFILLAVTSPLSAAPPATSPFIKVDQFGYLSASKKVAIISNPQGGFNAAQSFSPGTGTNQYQVRRWSNNVAVLIGSLQQWNNGQIHAQSGDQGWWFDFSDVTTPGSYYIYDTKNQVGSYRFEIGTKVYDKVLKQAVRMFYYQRVNYAKRATHAGKWADGAAFDGPNQDRAARSVNDKGNPNTARDLHGGWFDAGDLNKYTTLAFDPVLQMLEAYRLNPTVFKDNYNIPESGNGVPDLLDEVKYEIDWLTRMQDATGTNGLMLKVGVIDHNDVSPPSQDARPRYYVGECTSATIAGAGALALGGLVYRALPQPGLAAYGNNLVARAELAWERARVATQNYTVFQTECDSQEIKAGDADRSAQRQKNNLATAAVYLYEATGKPTYRTYVENHYAQVNAFIVGPSWPYEVANSFALLHYTTLPGVSSTVAQIIINRKASKQPAHNITDYQAKTDLYRAFMADRAYHWGSNYIRSNSGNVLLDFNSFDINKSDKAVYREAAEEYIHWLHGANPLGLVMLSNMYGYGAERSANEISHAWFDNGTKYDNAQTSSVGPAPGYLTGGPNKDYPLAAFSPPYGQPPQKAYRDWNTSWNGSLDEAAYQITEPAIYYQGGYVALLSRIIATGGGAPPPVADNSRYIYQDALASGWQNWSWSTSIDFAQSAVVQQGSRAMKVTFQQSWGASGVSLRSEEAVSTSGYQAIRMQVHGGSGSAQNLMFYVQTEDSGAGSATKAITVPANKWQEVTILLSDLGSPSVIKRITVQNNAAQAPTTFYIDDLRLIAGPVAARTAASPADMQSIQAYPNELGERDALQLQWNEVEPGTRRVEVLDMQGRVVYRTTHQGGHLQIDRTYFRPAGVYMVRVQPVNEVGAQRTEVFRILAP